MQYKRWISLTALCVALLLIPFKTLAMADDGSTVWGYQLPDKYYVGSFVQDDMIIDQVIVPERPPEFYCAQAVDISELPLSTDTVVLSNVPAFDWCYGCSATSAAMLAGYYDNDGYPKMYLGLTNGGLCPLNNSAWGSGECPLSATHMGYDNRTSRGHVDDYWNEYLDPGPDPYVGNWPEHTWSDCTADYMGTNQSKYGNADGSTTFYFYTDGSRLYDYSGCEPYARDGCHGLRQFVESRGYTVSSNYSQYIVGYNNNSNGFTFADFQTEINAGRPVLIQVAGHTMLGFGYTTSTNKIYVHNTWDHSSYVMTWGGVYSGMQHYGVTTIQIAAAQSTVSISGRVTLGGSGLPNISIACSNNSPAYVKTDSNGRYEILVTAGWKGTVQPISDDYSFQPQSITYSEPLYGNVSDVNFAATKRLLLVSSPNGGEVWPAGSAQTIKWTYGTNSGSRVRIELYKGGMLSGTVVKSASIGKNGSGSYKWTIPSTTAGGEDYRILVRSTTNASFIDSSDGNFTIQSPQIKVVYPNGGENWRAGFAYTINWDYTGYPGSRVKIDLYRGGVLNRNITKSASVGSSGRGAYKWMVPSKQASGYDYTVRITSTSNSSCWGASNSLFGIQGIVYSLNLTSPNGGEVWRVKSVQTIRWTYSGSIGSSVRIDLYKSGALVRTIIRSRSIGSNGAGYYRCTVPSTLAAGNDYAVRITSSSGYMDTSAYYFTIQK